MVFVKGEVTNPIGREKGSKNNKTVEWEIFREWFLDTGIFRLRQEMEKLEGKDLVYTVKDLLEYFQPKLARNENKNEMSGEVKISWDKN